MSTQVGQDRVEDFLAGQQCRTGVRSTGVTVGLAGLAGNASILC